MKVTPAGGSTVDLGITETKPTISIVDYSRRVTDDFGVTTVVERDFSRRLSLRFALATDTVDSVQRTFADLRAAKALWVADDRYSWLSVTGFYKDFEVDLPGAAISYCTLSVEGIAERETVADDGREVAPEGQASTLSILRPLTVTDSILIASNVAENDAAAWSSSTTYAMGAKVVRAHRVYESLIAGNVGADPAADPTKWLDTGPTRRWAMFDQALGTATTNSGSVAVTLRATGVTAIALLDLKATSVRVQATGYDQTQAAGPGTVTFLDLAGVTGDFVVTITGSGTVSVGTLLIGSVASLGITEASPTASITDFSRKEVDDFGDVTIVQRAWAKKMAARSLIATDALDIVANRIAAIRARPSLWIGQAGTDALTIYGFFRDFLIEVGETVSKLSLSIEGLSKAPPLAAPTPEGASVVAQGSVDAVSWHVGLQTGDVYLRISNDSGVTFGAAVRIAGEDGEPGEDGSYQQQIFRRSPTRPATPTGGGIPSGWSDGVPDGTDLIWMSVSYQRNGVSLGPWSLPAQIKGDRGEAGLNAPLVLVQWSADGATNWHFDYAEGDKFQRQSNDNGATWGPAVRVVGESATSGQDGISPSIVFRRSATIPATPTRDTGNPPTGWSDDPPPGTDFLWQSVSKFRNAMQLEDWSAPVRITGPAGQDGASAFTLRNIVNTTVESASITKAGGTSGQWDAKARTLESGANVTVGGLLPKGSFLGLTTDPEANNSFDTIDYTWHRSGDPNYGVGVFRNGVSLVNTPEIGDQYAASVFTTTVRDGIVIYAREGIEYYRHSAAAASETLYGVSAIANVGASVRGVTFAVNGKAGEPGLSAPLVRTQWSVDGVSNWHDNYMGADLFYRQSNDNGVTWGPAIRGVGESGTGVAVAFRRSATVPPTPPSNTGNPPSGWNDGPPAGTDFLWLIKANFVNGTQQTAWSSPQRISGEDGFVLSVNPPAFVIPAFSNGTAKPSWTGGSCVLSLNKGGQAITPDGGYSIAAQNGVASLTISGNTATFAGILADKAEFTVRATYQGKAYDQRVTLVRARDGEAAFKGSVNLSGSGSFATAIVVGSGVSVVPAGRGTIISGYGDYFVNQAQPGNFQGRLYLYWRNVTDNGAWNLLGSETGSFSTSTNVGTPSEPEYQVSYGTVSASFGFIAPASGDKQIAFEARLERASGALGADMTGQLKLEVSS